MAPSFGRSISFPLSPARPSRPRAAAYPPLPLPPAPRPPLHPHRRHPRLGRRPLLPVHRAQPPRRAPHRAVRSSELLLLPESRAALRHGSATAACLLDGFLILADAHGAFQEAAVEVRAHAADAQAALRRLDDNRLASAVRSLRRAEKDLTRLAASVRTAAKFPTMLFTSTSSEEAEVSGALVEAVATAACASAAVFSAVESVSAAATSALVSKKTVTSSFMSLVKISKPAASDEDMEVLAVERLEDVEACLAATEAGSDKVFRSILCTRVALLNIQTETCC